MSYLHSVREKEQNSSDLHNKNSEKYNLTFIKSSLKLGLVYQFLFLTIRLQFLNNFKYHIYKLKIDNDITSNHKEKNEFYLYSLAPRTPERVHGLEHFLRGQNMG